jgi:hypothetical protein
MVADLVALLSGNATAAGPRYGPRKLSSQSTLCKLMKLTDYNLQISHSCLISVH